MSHLHPREPSAPPRERLCGVVNQHVYSPILRCERVAEGLDHANIRKLERSHQLQVRFPLGKVVLPREPERGIRRESRGGHDGRAGAHELKYDFVSDAHATAGDDADETVHVGRLLPLGKVEGGAWRAQLMIEFVDLRGGGGTGIGVGRGG